MQSVTTQCAYSLSTVMKEVQTSWTCGSDSSEQDLCADGETCWKAVELGRCRREVDSVNNIHARKIQLRVLCSEFICGFRTPVKETSSSNSKQMKVKLFVVYHKCIQGDGGLAPLILKP